jgi:hypothetical protein
MLIPRWINWYYLISSFFVTSCGNDQISDFKETRQSQVQIDLRGLKTFSNSGNLQDVASVVDSLNLKVLPRDGTDQLHSRKLTQTDSIITFDIEVERGPVEFNAEIFSNNQTLIYAGSDAFEVREDGFEVRIQLMPVNAILAIEPDSLFMGADGVFSVLNKGTKQLEWWVEEIIPELKCGNVLCLQIRPESDFVPAKSSMSVTAIFNGDTLGTNFLVRLASQVGHVEFNVLTADSAQ